MDAIDPAAIDAAEAALAQVEGVRAVGSVRMRWIGHALRAEADIVVDANLTVVQAHALAVDAEHALMHAVPRLTAVTVHADHPPPPGTTGTRTPRSPTTSTNRRQYAVGGPRANASSGPATLQSN
jgi:divalent metal cation (Fe/Co/Zn/Cd) transporter